MGIKEAVAQFRRAAMEKGELASPAAKDHELHAAMAEAWRTLVAHGEEGIAAFRGLIADESPHVQGWVAAQMLSEGDECGVAPLERLAKAEGLIGLSATMTLREWRAGRLRCPFGNAGP